MKNTPRATNQRECIRRAAIWFLESGLVTGTAGNISVREDGGRWFLITPSGFDYRLMHEEDIVRVELDGQGVEGRRRPSSECELHKQIYRMREDVKAVVHSHSPYATSVAVARQTIPNILDETADLTPIPTVDYAVPGSLDLANRAAAKFSEGYNAVLLANHGVVVTGASLNEALHRSVDVERLAQLFVWAETLGGAVPLEDWAVTRSRNFLKEYAANRALQSPDQAEPLPVWSGTVSVVDLVRFGFRTWVTFGSMFQALLMQRLRR
jgi:L-fuculose-phosphate aldolase